MTLDDRIEQPTAGGRQPARADRPTKGRKAKRAARQAAKAGTRTAKAAGSEQTAGADAGTGADAATGTDAGQAAPANAEPRVTAEAGGAKAGGAARLVGAGAPRWALAEPAASTYATRTVRDSPTDTASSPRPAAETAAGDVVEAVAEDVAETAPGDVSEAVADGTKATVDEPATDEPATDVSADAEPEATRSGETRGAPSADPAAMAFDLLHITHAAALSRQAYLLTGNREVSRWSVDRAFHAAWEHWPEVATDPDPAGWVRAVVHEYALSPWLRFWPGHGAPEPYDGPPEHRALLLAFWGLPRAYRRAVLLHDGLGLSLAETAAETEASTPATLGRLRHGREALAVLVPEVADAGRDEGDDEDTGPGDDLGSDERGAVVGALLARAAAAHQVRPQTSRAVRTISEHATRRWTLGACGLTAVLVMATSFTIATTETDSLLPTGLPATVAELAR